MKTTNHIGKVLGSILAIGFLAASLTSGTVTRALSPQKSALTAHTNLRLSKVTCHFGQGLIPINLGLPSGLISGGSPVSCSVTVESVPSGGGEIQLMCDQPALITSPSSSWPCTISYADGASTTANFTLTPNGVCTTTTVHIYAGTTDDDPDDLSTWNVVGSLTMSVCGPG